MNLRSLKMIVVMFLCVATLMLSACGKSLSGTYVSAANYTIDFSEDGTCMVQNDGVTWPGTYDYDGSSGTFKLTVSSLGGSVEVYSLRQEDENLVLNRNGFDFVFKPYDVWQAENIAEDEIINSENGVSDSDAEFSNQNGVGNESRDDRQDSELYWRPLSEAENLSIDDPCIVRNGMFATLDYACDIYSGGHEMPFPLSDGSGKTMMSFNNDDDLPYFVKIDVSQGDVLASFELPEDYSFTAYPVEDETGYCSDDRLKYLFKMGFWGNAWYEEGGNYDEAISKNELAINGETVSVSNPSNDGEVRNAINAILEGTGVRLVASNPDVFIGARGDSVDVGLYSGNRWDETTVDINRPYLVYGDSDNPIELNQMRTKEGYIQLDTSKLAPGKYVIHRLGDFFFEIV